MHAIGDELTEGKVVWYGSGGGVLWGGGLIGFIR